MDNLRELRQKAGYTQKDIACYLGIDRTTYVKYETGASEPNIDTITKLANYFGVSTDFLLGNKSVEKDAYDIDAFQFALYGETKDLSDDQKQDVMSFIRFVKSKEEKKGDN